MPVKFEVQMTDKVMFDFMLYHSYTSISGILGVVIGIVSLVCGIQGLVSGRNNAVLFLFFAFLLLAYIPLTLKRRSKLQVVKSEMFKKPICYELKEDGVHISQGDVSEMNPWEGFWKAVSTKRSVILYISKTRALIFPKEELGDQYEEAVRMISAHMPPKQVNIK